MSSTTAAGALEAVRGTVDTGRTVVLTVLAGVNGVGLAVTLFVTGRGVVVVLAGVTGVGFAEALFVTGRGVVVVLAGCTVVGLDVTLFVTGREVVVTVLAGVAVVGTGVALFVTLRGVDAIVVLDGTVVPTRVVEAGLDVVVWFCELPAATAKSAEKYILIVVNTSRTRGNVLIQDRNVSRALYPKP